MITNRIIEQKLVEWRKLKWFQSQELKELSRDDMERLKTSLKNRSFVQPFNVWLDLDGTLWILDGHHRQKAMEELIAEGVQIEDLLPANFIQCSTRKEAAELVLLYSSWYARISRTGIQDYLKEHAIDVSEINLEMNIPHVNLNSIANTDFNNSGDEYPVPELQVETITVRGDVYHIGPHRLVCGDSTSTDDCKLLMQHDLAHLVFTDPPYNLSIDAYVTSDKRSEKFGEFAMASGEMSQQQFTEFLRTIFRNLVQFSTDGSIHYICMDWRHMTEMCLAWPGIYTEQKNLAFWNKSVGGMGTFYRSKHELVFVFKNGKTPNPVNFLHHINAADVYVEDHQLVFILKNGTAPHVNNFELGQYGRYRTNVWDYEHATMFSSKKSATEGSLDLHPTPKSTQMISDAIMDCSNTKDIVLDLFGGSGTTMIAADRVQRRSRLMELDPRYCDVIVRRWIGYCQEIGRTCTIVRNGQTVSLETFVPSIPSKKQAEE